MKRKLIQLSPTTLVLSLPKEWTAQQRLKKGAYLDVVAQGSTLLIKADERPLQKTAKISVSGSIKRDANRLTDWYKIYSAYIRGYTHIKLTFPDKQAAQGAEHFVAKFPGFIVDQITGKEVMLRDIGADIVDVDKIVQRIFHLLVSITTEPADPVLRKKKDAMVNSYVALGLRQLRLQSYDILTWSGLLYNLEQLGDLLVHSKTKDELLVKDLQVLYLSFTHEHLLHIFSEMKSGNALHQQILGCAQSIQQVRENLE